MLHIVCIMSIALSPALAPYKYKSDQTVKIPEEEIKDFRGFGYAEHVLKLKDGAAIRLPVDSCVITRIYK